MDYAGHECCDRRDYDLYVCMDVYVCVCALQVNWHDENDMGRRMYRRTDRHIDGQSDNVCRQSDNVGRQSDKYGLVDGYRWTDNMGRQTISADR